MMVWFIILVSGAYLLGSVPVSNIAAKLSKGIDLREYGTGQVGGGNLWRMTSWKVALPVTLFDIFKGVVMVLAAHSIGLDISRQLVVGVAVIIGHNWSVFLRFGGGRGLGTAGGVVIILPIINEITPWVTIAFVGIIVIGRLVMRSSPLPVLIAFTTLPITSWWLDMSLSVTLVFLVVLIVVVVKRLMAQSIAETGSISKRRIFFYRLLYDRDIPDRKAWMYRKPKQHNVYEFPGRGKYRRV